MPPSELRKYIAARREPTWFELRFPHVELPHFFMKILDGAAFSLLSIRTWLMILLTFIATFISAPAMLNLSWKASMGIVAVGTVFPLVFAIQAAYGARQTTVKALGQLKGRTFYLYYHLKALGSTTAEPFLEASSKLMVCTMKSLINNTPADESYDTMAELVGAMTKGLMEKDKLAPPLVGGILGTVQAMQLDLEVLREVRDYETPKGLRHVAVFLICTIPIFLAPFWLSFCDKAVGGSVHLESDGDEGGPHPHGCFAGYFMAAIFVIITFSLLRVQEALEDPFDGMGEDDIQWQIWARNLDMLEMHGPGGKEMRDKAKDEPIEEEPYQEGKKD